MKDGLNIQSTMDIKFLQAFIDRFPMAEYRKATILDESRIMGLVNSDFEFKNLADRTTRYDIAYLEQALEILAKAGVREFHIESVKGMPLRIKPAGCDLILIIAAFSESEQENEDD